MDRRKFLIGAGSLAAGSAAAMGSGAFSAMSASRDANIDVVTDGNGLIALSPGAQADGRVYEADDGLKIDFTSDQGASGVNIDSRYQVGTWNSAGGDFGSDLSWDSRESDDLLELSPGGVTPAFEIQNQDDTSHEMSVGYEANGPVGDASLHFQFVKSNGDKQYLDIDSDTPSDSFTESTGSGSSLRGVIFVDTRDVTDKSLDLSGTLTVSAD